MSYLETDTSLGNNQPAGLQRLVQRRRLAWLQLVLDCMNLLLFFKLTLIRHRDDGLFLKLSFTAREVVFSHRLQGENH